MKRGWIPLPTKSQEKRWLLSSYQTFEDDCTFTFPPANWSGSETGERQTTGRIKSFEFLLLRMDFQSHFLFTNLFGKSIPELWQGMWMGQKASHGPATFTGHRMWSYLATRILALALYETRVIIIMPLWALSGNRKNGTLPIYDMEHRGGECVPLFTRSRDNLELRRLSSLDGQ